MALIPKVISRFRQSVERTRKSLVEGVGGLRELLIGRALDERVIADLERLLLQADVGVAATRRLIDGLRADYKSGAVARGEDALDYLKRSVKAMWPSEDRRLHEAPAGSGPTVILVVGINGAGKTTSIARLCHLLRAQGRTVLLAACDTFRAGAVRQLEIWAERLGVEVVKGQHGGDPAAVAFDACTAAKARAADVLIIDTAGRLHTQDPLMRQLAKIRDVLARQIPGAPHETLLVLDATSGQNALRQAEEFSKCADITGVFLAKLDGTAKGGIVLAIREAATIPVKFVGVGETPADIQPFDPDAFVEALFSA